MKVLFLAGGRKYDVLALCDDDDTCQVLDMLRAADRDHPDLVARMTAHLYQMVPDQGPQLDGYRGKELYDDFLYELREEKNVGRGKYVGLRLAFFFDHSYHGGSVIVCTNAFYKLGSSTPEPELTRALTLRAEYLQNRDELEWITELRT
jgi:hypothetical protein